MLVWSLEGLEPEKQQCPRDKAERARNEKGQDEAPYHHRVMIDDMGKE